MPNENQTNSGAWGQFKEAVRKAVRSLWPGLGEFDNFQYGRISKLNLAGGKVGTKGKGISANIKLLNRDLSENLDREEIKDVPFDSMLFNAAGVLYSIPQTGAICRIGFMYNDSGFPFIHSVSNEGATIPGTTEGKFIIDAGNGDTVTIDSDGITARSGGAAFRIRAGDVAYKSGIYNCSLSEIFDKFLIHCHISAAPASPTATPIIPPSTPILPADFNTGIIAG